MSWSKEEVEKLIVEIKKKAAFDEEFRKKLLSDPKAAVKELTGKEIPENLKIQVIEQDPEAQVTLVIPPYKGDELDEGDLEKVAGGACAAAACAGDVCISAVK